MQTTCGTSSLHGLASPPQRPMDVLVGSPSPLQSHSFSLGAQRARGCQAPSQKIANFLESAHWRRMRRNSHVRCEDECCG